MQQTFVVPYLRSSPIHLPRRDLVLAASDSVLLAVSVIESDDPAAEALVIPPGFGAPTLRMTVWADSQYWGNDYGMWQATLGCPLWAGVGTVSDTEVGTFELLVPIATMVDWPRRCLYALQLDWGGNTRSETLAQGALHVRQGAINGSFAPVALLTDDGAPVLEDDATPVLT